MNIKTVSAILFVLSLIVIISMIYGIYGQFEYWTTSIDIQDRYN